ncbi:MAG: putative rane protein [Herbinix sp.]|nr:putative rane protein [Herbinix sp.]
MVYYEQEKTMVGLGTIANMSFILIGATVGILFKGVLKQRFQDTIMNALGLAVMFVGISGALQGLFTVEGKSLGTANTMLMIVSLAIGAFFGELINIEARLERVGEKIRSVLKVQGETGQNFVEGFVNSSLLFCIGAMAIIGSLQDGLSGDASMLYAKGFIDGTCSIFFASTLGIGVFFSVIPLGLYQGAITLLAKYIEPYLSDQMIVNISCIGSVLIFGIGVNMIFGKKIKCGNLLPAVFVPVVYELVMKLF